MDTTDLAVVGGGAAGLAAAIFAAERAGGRLAVTVLDGAKTLGAKILVSGGGRCNVTHESVSTADLHGTQHVLRHILAGFDAKAAVKWFASLGVELKREETGKLFPVTDRARTVLDALMARCRELGVAIRPGHRVTDVQASRRESHDRFVIVHERGALQSRQVILATGGRSLPRTGSDGFGYELARRLGHTVVPTAPALVPLVLRDDMFHRELSGLSQEAELTVAVDNHLTERRRGSLLWTHFGVSGPVVLDVSRAWTLAAGRGATAEIRCNFVPGWTEERASAWLAEQAAGHPRRSLAGTLALRVPERLAVALCRRASCDPRTQIAQLPRPGRRCIIAALTRFVLPVEGHRGWNHAEVTAGGVPLEEVDFRTMESRTTRGLYLVGEILDCDGRIGGFNFQWAWSTGYLAGRAAAAVLCESALP